LNVHKEDGDSFFVLSPKGWTADELSLWWLKNVYHPCSKNRYPGKTLLLFLDRHDSHITFDFVNFYEKNDIILYFLPAHSSHLLQPLDIRLFSPLQHHYSKAVEDNFLTTSISITRDIFRPHFKKAQRKDYIVEIFQNAFRETGIVPLYSIVVLENLKLHAPKLPQTITESIMLVHTASTLSVRSRACRAPNIARPCCTTLDLPRPAPRDWGSIFFARLQIR
jgi:hypothetical protein